MHAAQASPWSGRVSARFAYIRSPGSSGKWLDSLVCALILALVGVYIFGFLIAAYFRVTYAYPMWVMEVPSLQAVRRIMLGQPLYGPPTLAYVPAVYAPLYFYVSALAAHVLGTPLMTLRLVSLAASLGTGLLGFHMVWRETRNSLAAVIGVGLIISSTALTAGTLDLARVDALCVFSW